ncbi:MAG: alpha/beta fold hydrolase [Flavobacteriaceae bacterium]|tara:strand:+ start:708 stop:1472 length:765 start_codon:yes stop_codon:yes gene_type:complete
MLLHSKILGNSNKHILILHGFLGSGDNWISIARKLTENNFSVHLIDQRNHGRSFHSDEFNYELMCNDLLNYISYYKIKNMILIGHSMGGKTAMKFSLKYPKLILKLIVVDTSPKYYPIHHQYIIDALKKIDFNFLNSRKKIKSELEKCIKQEGLISFIMKNIYWKEEGVLDFRFNLKSLSDNIDKIGEELKSDKKFYKEVFFFKGEKSHYILDSDNELIFNYYPNSSIISISNAGHWLHADRPDEFVSKLLALI